MGNCSAGGSGKVSKCGETSCQTCGLIIEASSISVKTLKRDENTGMVVKNSDGNFEFTTSDIEVGLEEELNCCSPNVIYIIKCGCNRYYIGETEARLKDRILGHMNGMNDFVDTHLRRSLMNCGGFKVMPIKTILSKADRTQEERILIKTHSPELNIAHNVNFVRFE